MIQPDKTAAAQDPSSAFQLPSLAPFSTMGRPIAPKGLEVVLPALPARPSVSVGADAAAAPATQAAPAAAPPPAAPASAIVTYGAEGAAAAAATPTGSFFSQHKAEIAVIGIAIALPLMLLALKGGSHDAEVKRQAALRAKYAPQKEGPTFEEDFLDKLAEFERA